MATVCISLQLYYTRKTISNLRGLHYASCVCTAGNHNNAIMAWKDEEAAWHGVLGEIICVSVCVCRFEGVTVQLSKAQCVRRDCCLFLIN